MKSEISDVSTREKARDPFSAQHIPYPVGTFESMIFRTSPGEICTIVPWRVFCIVFLSGSNLPKNILPESTER